MKRIEDIKEFKDIDTYYEISKIVDEVFQDRVETHKHLITANKEIERLNNIIEEKNTQIRKLEYIKENRDNLLEGKDKEIKRLNNIINELEKWLENEIKFRKVVGKDFELRKALNVLQILKGSDKE